MNRENESLISTGDIARMFGTTNDVVIRHIKKVLPGKEIRNGIKTLVSREEVELLTKSLRKTQINNPNSTTFVSMQRSITTPNLWREDRQQKALEGIKALQELIEQTELEKQEAIKTIKNKDKYIEELEKDNKFKNMALQSFINLSSPRYEEEHDGSVHVN
jgi:hypothetical protein